MLIALTEADLAGDKVIIGLRGFTVVFYFLSLYPAFTGKIRWNSRLFVLLQNITVTRVQVLSSNRHNFDSTYTNWDRINLEPS